MTKQIQILKSISECIYRSLIVLWIAFPAFPYEQSNKTLARLERLAASPFFDGRVALLTGPTIFRERLSEKVPATTPKGIVGGFEFTRPQRNLKQWYTRGHGSMFASAKGKQQK